MPEGDTIYRAARALQRAIGGRAVAGFETGLAKLARVNDDSPVVGRVVERVESRGKWLLIYFSGDLILVSHMLMSGSWHLYRVGERWRMRRSNMRVVVRTGEYADPTHAMKPHEWGTQSRGAWEAVLFNAQIAEFYTARTLERSGHVSKLGLDVLSDEFTVEVGVA